MPKQKTLDFDCKNIKIIPQFAEDTCWFNAILMASLYSQRSRKLMKLMSKKWKSKETIYKIIKIIIFKLYNNPAKTERFFKKIRPSLLLLKMFRYFKDLDFINKIRKDIKKNIYAFAWTIRYISRFYKYLGLKCLDLTYLTETKMAYTNLMNYITIVSTNKTLSYIFNKEKFIHDANLNKINYGFEKGEYPDIIVLYHSSLTGILGTKSKKMLYEIRKMLKKQKVFKYDTDYYSKLKLDTHIKNYTGIDTYEDTITLNGVKYELDSCLISNYNDIPKHAIVGITCNNERYIYNGREFNKQDKKNTTCPLWKFDWNLKSNKSFCLSKVDCNLYQENIDIKEKKTQCYSFSKGNRVLVYIRSDSKKKTPKTPLITTDASISNLSSIIEDIYLHDIDKYSENEIIEFIKKIKGNHFTIPHDLTKNGLKYLYYTTVKDYYKERIKVSPLKKISDTIKKVDEKIKKLKKECPPDKIYNEKTKRCVSKTGAIGKKILGLKSL